MKHLNKILSVFMVALMLIFVTDTTFAAKPARGTPPAVPTGLSAGSITTSDITLTWSAVTNATGYKIYRGTPNDSNYSLIATLSSTSYKNSNLTAGTNYWYFVRAYNTYGTSSDSIHIKATTLVPTPAPTSSKKVLGFTTYYYSGDTSSYNSMAANTSLIDDIASLTYTTDGLGNISGLVPSNQITYANSNGINALAMVNNNFDGNIAKTLLESPTNRQALINNTISALKANGYKGVNIDLEGVFSYDRSYYTTFMSEVYNALKPLGYTVTVSVPAKTSDSPTNTWSGAYDYAQLGQYADEVVLMTYDEHYPGGTPGAVASIGWVESVIKYAVTVIPKEKILLGTAAYGYDWSSSGTKGLSITGAYNLAATYGVTVQWDATSKTPYFNYTDASGIAHSVWFENSTSLGYKLDLVNSYGLSGIAIWRLGLENSDYWTTIKTKFNR